MAPFTKSELREQARNARDTMSERERGAGAEAVAEHFALAINGKIVSAYNAIGSELDPSPLIERLTIDGADLALPVLLDRERMIFRQWHQTKSLVPVGFGTLGPDDSQPTVDPDIVLLPLLAFTGTGQRIGYGKGHYDRALDAMAKRGLGPLRIGLAFDGQEVPPFPVEEHDIPLDAVLTPSGLRVFETGKARIEAFLPSGTAATDPS